MGGKQYRDSMARVDLRRCKQCADALDRARFELEKAIMDARASGETLRDIAEAAGISHQRVWQILNKKA